MYNILNIKYICLALRRVSVRIPIFFISSLCIIIFVFVSLKKTNSGFRKKIDNFQKREMKANSTIRHNLSELPYVFPKKENLPIKEYDNPDKFKKIIKLQKAALKKTELDMIKFQEEYTNTDLKLMYGNNNLEKIMFFEEHYNGYVRILQEWAEALIALENIDDAEIVLLEAIQMKTDLSKTYTMLADIYAQKNDSQKLNELLEKTNEIKIYQKDKIISYIKNLI